MQENFLLVVVGLSTTILGLLRYMQVTLEKNAVNREVKDKELLALQEKLLKARYVVLKHKQIAQDYHEKWLEQLEINSELRRAINRNPPPISAVGIEDDKNS